MRAPQRVLYIGRGEPMPGTIIRRLSLGDNGLVRVKLDRPRPNGRSDIRTCMSEGKRRAGRAFWRPIEEPDGVTEEAGR